jgi:hypothetical protein
MFARIAIACLLIAGCQPASETAVTPPDETAAAEAAAGAEPAPELVVSTPAVGARVTSPVRVEGSAPGPWYFEAVLPAQIVVEGQMISEAPAQAQSDWMTTERVPFVAVLEFSVAAETPAELVLTEDMPKYDQNGEELPLREVRIPVVLVPSP